MNNSGAMEFQIVFDGGSKGNPGLGYGSFAIFFEEEVVIHEEIQLGDGVTNNEAEYRTLIEALERLLTVTADQLPRARVTIYSDSQLLVNQVNGQWKIKKPELFTLRNRVVELLNHFGKTDLKWHSRTNSVAVLGH